MSIHGYNSKGKWQDALSNYLQELNLISTPYKYGRKILKILPYNIKNDVKKFRDWYFSIIDNPAYGLKISEPFHRPSIIAHSLGTWILAKALTKYPEIKFDKIFLFGSIIPANFDWFKLILRDQVNSVVYEKANKDIIVPLGLIFTGSIKPCGTKGFIQKSSFIKEEVLSLFGHSDFNYKAHLFQYLNKRLPEKPHQLCIVAGRDLDEKHVRKIFMETGSKIDEIIYPEEYQETPITLERAIEWFRIEKDIWSFIKNVYTNVMLGYINAIPVNNIVYNKFCSGELKESKISAADILDYDTCTSYNLLILSIAIKKKVLDEETMLIKGRIAEMLIMSFIYKINQHNNGNNKLNKIAAFAWSDEGKKLCEGFCMKQKENSSNEHPLYEIDLKTLEKSTISQANFMSKWWYEQLLN
jgi:hypothetical protein